MTEKYLSMQEAASFCTYDQEYLSLLARRGLLRAEKIGRRWYTTTEWLNDYLRLKRPNEIITPETPQEEVAVAAEIQSGRNVWALFLSLPFRKVFFFLLGVVILISAGMYFNTMRKINALEKKTGGSKFILNEIVKIPDDEGNMKTYGSGMVPIEEQQ